jgi:hypothetical protein
MSMLLASHGVSMIGNETPPPATTWALRRILGAIMGGVEIRVPPHWRVITNGTPILGGIDNRTFDPTDSNVIAPTLIVNSTVILGGLEIHP